VVNGRRGLICIVRIHKKTAESASRGSFTLYDAEDNHYFQRSENENCGRTLSKFSFQVARLTRDYA
jgi:hypothetical protein